MRRVAEPVQREIEDGRGNTGAAGRGDGSGEVDPGCLEAVPEFVRASQRAVRIEYAIEGNVHRAGNMAPPQSGTGLLDFSPEARRGTGIDNLLTAAGGGPARPARRCEAEANSAAA